MKNKIDEFQGTRKRIKDAIEKRHGWLEDEKESQASRCNTHFRNFCNLGGYTGSLEILHAKRDYNEQLDRLEKVSSGTIEIKVKPPGQQQDASIGNLSGGERSYITVCFICALWSVMDSPFKFLDEFDVFMDVKHRDLAVNLLYEVGTKTQSGAKQIFLLTPNDVKSKSVISNFDTTNCNVFQLKDQQASFRK